MAADDTVTSTDIPTPPPAAPVAPDHAPPPAAALGLAGSLHVSISLQNVTIELRGHSTNPDAARRALDDFYAGVERETVAHFGPVVARCHDLHAAELTRLRQQRAAADAAVTAAREGVAQADADYKEALRTGTGGSQALTDRERFEGDMGRAVRLLSDVSALVAEFEQHFLEHLRGEIQTAYQDFYRTAAAERERLATEVLASLAGDLVRYEVLGQIIRADRKTLERRFCKLPD